MDLSNRLFFRHPLYLFATTSNSGNRLSSLLSCIFLEIDLDTIQTRLPHPEYRVTNPTVIHRFTTFLGMTALSSRSEVSFLSRGVSKKEGSKIRQRGPRDETPTTRSTWRRTHDLTMFQEHGQMVCQITISGLDGTEPSGKPSMKQENSLSGRDFGRNALSPGKGWSKQ